MKLLFLNMACLTVLSMFHCCGLVRYGKGVQEDVVKTMHLHKERMVAIEYSGLVSKKSICKNCKEIKWQIAVVLNESNAREKLNSRITFPPYYRYENDTLFLAVTKHIYNNISVMDTIVKNRDSYNLIIKGQEFNWLSQEQGKWLE